MNLKLTWIDSHETMKTFLYSTNRCESAVASSHKMHAPKRILKQKRSITGPDIILLLPRVFLFSTRTTCLFVRPFSNDTQYAYAGGVRLKQLKQKVVRVSDEIKHKNGNKKYS